MLYDEILGEAWYKEHEIAYFVPQDLVEIREHYEKFGVGGMGHSREHLINTARYFAGREIADSAKTKEERAARGAIRLLIYIACDGGIPGESWLKKICAADNSFDREMAGCFNYKIRG